MITALVLAFFYITWGFWALVLWNLFALVASTPAIRDRIVAHCRKHPYEHIYNNGDLYMERFWLFRERRWLLGAGARLHIIHRPDYDRVKHDHPTAFRTVILQNGYTQEDIFGIHERLWVGDTERRPEGYFHRITEIHGGPAYTLFFYGGPRQL